MVLVSVLRIRMNLFYANSIRMGTCPWRRKSGVKDNAFSKELSFPLFLAIKLEYLAKLPTQ